MTFYEALNEFEARYLSALAVDSRRVIDLLDQDWQTINNEYDLYIVATSEGRQTEADGHIQNILEILSANNIVVTEPVADPSSPAVSNVPSSITIACDAGGTPQSGAFDDAYSYIYIRIGKLDDTANWTYTITGTTDVTANNSTIQNRIDITAIADDSGSVEVTCSQAAYDDFVINIVAYKHNISLTGAVLTTGAQTASGIKTWSDQAGFSNGFLVTGGNVFLGAGVDLGLNSGDITMDGKIIQSGVSTEYQIEPYVALSVGKETNNAGFGVHIYKGDGTATINHNFEGVGDSYVCGDNGNFGIGDQTPSEKLEVVGNILASGDIKTSGGNFDLGVDNYFQTVSSVTNYILPYKGSNSRMEFVCGNGTSSQGGWEFWSGTPTLKVFFRGDGNCGWNTSTPTEKIHVYNGNLLVESGVYKTDPVEVYQIDVSGVIVTPARDSNVLPITLVGTVNPSTVSVSVDLDNFEFTDTMPLHIPITLDAQDDGVTFNLDIRDSSNNVIKNITRLLADETEYWGLTLIYAPHTTGSAWHVLGGPIESYS